ncbi:MAG: topoisomerase C-terminal repeat-containing protein [Lachnospiraceae bacterium]|nr:topoisomerase C-terminal repeat-containing protein [Lachnospiraceae bacterium]
MGKNLIITEKPSVARDFARVLKVSGNKNGYIENDEYVISWCYGHLVSLVYPEEYDPKYKSWRLEDLPFLPEEYKYGVVESAKDQYVVVNQLLHREDIDTVYWAGDSGKEGQTIEENIRIYGGVRDGMTELRVWIDSQTDDEIMRGIREAKPMSEYARLGKSGLMRTIEDYALGINFSRALSVKYGRMINDAAATKNYTAISVGRVMTCVLGMVVRREREIRNFTETPFYRIVGNFTEGQFNAEWKAIEGSKYFESPLLYKENGFKKEEDAKNLIGDLQGKEAVVESKEETTSKKKPPLLFNLAELQSECSKRFKISPAQALDVAQFLYEQKFTTYPRTDARVLTTAVAKEITKNLNMLKAYPATREFVDDILDNNKYVGLDKTRYTDDSKVTDHYAIIPTGQVNGLDRLNSIQRAVYDLIVRRFLSIFYPAAEYKKTKLHIKLERENFYVSCNILDKPGFLTVAGMPQNSKDNNDNSEDGEESDGNDKEKLQAALAAINKGDVIPVNGYDIKEGKTSPPKRYTSGNLILAMENAGNLIEDEELREQIKGSGIGTSATRGDILEKLVRIGYLNQNNKTQIITPENLGEMIYEVIDLSAPNLLNPEMTASWEKGLDGIINGTVDDVEYRQKLEAYIRTETEKMINNNLTYQIAANINQFTGKDAKGLAARKPLGVKCPICGGELMTTSFGYGCSNYRNEDIKCRFAVGEICGVTIDEEQFKKLISEGKTDTIRGFKNKAKKSFDAVLRLEQNEEGRYGVVFDFSDVAPAVVEGVKCPNCGGDIIEKASGYSCSNYSGDDPESCRFYIGKKIASKAISLANVKELLTEKQTKTLRGFKGKSGKKFDACLKLQQDENGKYQVVFDFDNVEANVVKDAKCPFCGGAIVKTYSGFNCENYDYRNPDSPCKFGMGTMCGVKLNDGQIKELTEKGITGEIKGFKSKKGSTFDAKLCVGKDAQGKFDGIKFVFQDRNDNNANQGNASSKNIGAAQTSDSNKTGGVENGNSQNQ